MFGNHQPPSVALSQQLINTNTRRIFAKMMATEQPVAHMEEQQQNYDEGEMGEGEEEVSRNLYPRAVGIKFLEIAFFPLSQICLSIMVRTFCHR